MMVVGAVGAQAQWQMQDSGTTASLRGIHSLGKGVAWASGSNGTVLRTEDGGYLWQKCTVPQGAEKLDFRGVQGFDANTAFVMSSGPGDASRLYKTTDGCQTWTLVFTNPDPDGFFDTLTIPHSADPAYQNELMLLGDPVKGQMSLWRVEKDAKPGELPKRVGKLPKALPDEGAFAASNSALYSFADHEFWLFGTGGPGGARVVSAERLPTETGEGYSTDPGGNIAAAVPVGTHSKSSGVFSIAVKLEPSDIAHASHKPAKVDSKHPVPPEDRKLKLGDTIVAVGGDYMKPDDRTAIAAYRSRNDARAWKAATTQPHGYRSAVAYYAKADTWIAVGPNGTDISTDGGKNWEALHPGRLDAADADRNWNALSLPFVVGPKGRIAILRQDAIKATGPSHHGW